MSADIIMFTKASKGTGRPNGNVEVWLLDCGRWGVSHMSRSGNSSAYLGSFEQHHEAAARGRLWAMQLGADFWDEGETGGAA